MKHTGRKLLKALDNTPEIEIYATVCYVSPGYRFSEHRIIEPVKVIVTKSERTSPVKYRNKNLNFQIDIFKMKQNGNVSKTRIPFNRNSWSSEMNLVFFDTYDEALTFFKKKLVGADRKIGSFIKNTNYSRNWLYHMNSDVQKFKKKFL